MAHTSAWRGNCSRVELRCVVFVAALGACWLVAPGIGAQAQAPLVVVVSSTPDAPLVRRLAAELSLFGYRVEVAGRAPGETELQGLLRRFGGAALIAVDQSRQSADIIVASKAGDGSRLEHERLDPRRQADTNAVVLAERFRARLTELGIAPAAEPLPPEPVVVRPAPPPRVEPERRLWVAGGVGAESGGVGLLPEAQLELRAFPAPWLSTSAFGKLSLPSQVSAPEGRADVRLLAGGLLIDAYPVLRPVVVNVGLGAMLVDVQTAGQASSPWLGTHASVLVPGGLVQSGVGLRLSPRISAELRGFVGVCSPRVAVRIAYRTVADFGQPLLGATFGVAVGLF